MNVMPQLHAQSKTHLSSSGTSRFFFAFGAFLAGNLLNVLTVAAQVSDVLWAGQMGGTSYERIYDSTVERSGNVYLAGAFTGFGEERGLDSDPTSNVIELSTTNENAIVIKLDLNGNPIWVKELESTSDCAVYSLATDSEGNIWVTGDFRGTVDFDPGPGTRSFSSVGEEDIFLLKLDSLGNLLWVAVFGGSALDGGSTVEVDSEDNVYLSGRFRKTIDFDPGPATHYFTAHGFANLFITKFDPSGNFVWARRIERHGSIAGIRMVAEPTGDLRVAGFFDEDTIFDPEHGGPQLQNPSGVYDLFLAKLNRDGSFTWTKQFGEIYFYSNMSIAIDSEGSLYTSGEFRETVDFDPGLGIFELTPPPFGGYFVSKLDTNGDFDWCKVLGEGNSHQISIDGDDNIYTVGAIYDNQPIWSRISKLNSQGNTVWSRCVPDIIHDDSGHFGGMMTVAGDGLDHAYVLGRFSGTFTFDSRAGLVSMLGEEWGDIYIAKYFTGIRVLSVEAFGTSEGDVHFTVVFSEPVSSVDAPDFVIVQNGDFTHGVITDVSGSGTTYTVTVHYGQGAGTIRLDVVDDDSIVDGDSLPLGGEGAGNGNFTSGDAYTVTEFMPLDWRYLILAFFTITAIKWVTRTGRVSRQLR